MIERLVEAARQEGVDRSEPWSGKPAVRVRRGTRMQTGRAVSDTRKVLFEAIDEDGLRALLKCSSGHAHGAGTFFDSPGPSA
jgi:hypothetical protein